MRPKYYLILSGSLAALLLLLGMAPGQKQNVSALGPETKNLRMGLEIETISSEGVDSHTIHVRIVNTGPKSVTLVGKAPYDNKSTTYADWLKAKLCFLTFPELLPPSSQTQGFEKVSPNPQTTLSSGEEFGVAWKATGRYLKPEHYYKTTPYFPSGGLYGVRAKVVVHTGEGQDILLYSNEQSVAVGGSFALPKHGLAYVTHKDKDKQQVVLNLGSHHRIANGDVFRVSAGSFSGWMLTVVEVRPFSSVAKSEKTGPRKDTLEALPPKSGKAQLWEFGQRTTVSEVSVEIEQIASLAQVSAEHTKHLVHIGKTRRELEKIYYGDGGIFSPMEGERYVLMDQPKGGPEGHVLKVRVLFRPAEVSDEVYKDPKKFREWMREHKGYGSQDDIVVDVSTPYWEPPYGD